MNYFLHSFKQEFSSVSIQKSVESSVIGTAEVHNILFYVSRVLFKFESTKTLFFFWGHYFLNSCQIASASEKALCSSFSCCAQSGDREKIEEQKGAEVEWVPCSTMQTAHSVSLSLSRQNSVTVYFNCVTFVEMGVARSLLFISVRSRSRGNHPTFDIL